jgi:hypothetical protein
MEAMALIVISKGQNIKVRQFNEETALSFYPGFVSRFRPMQVLLSMASASGVGQGQAIDHFIRQLPKKLIEVRTKSTKAFGRKATGKWIKFEHTGKSRMMETDVKSLDKFLANFELEGGSFSGYRRLFSYGDVDGFDFQWGGRLYGVGDLVYQTIKKIERQKMTIGGEEVVEIDINA